MTRRGLETADNKGKGATRALCREVPVTPVATSALAGTTADLDACGGIRAHRERIELFGSTAPWSQRGPSGA